MSARAAFYDALVADPVLNGYGINDDTVFHNWSNEERPSDSGPFAILRWQNQDRPVFGDPDARVLAPERLTIWVHYPKELTNDYMKLIKVLDQIDIVASRLRDLTASDGYKLSFVQIGGRSGDYVDDGFNTISKTGDYELYARLDSTEAGPPKVTVVLSITPNMLVEKIPPPEPVSHFDFHEGSGTTTTSIVPGGRTLTQFGGAGWVAGGIQGAFSGAVGPAVTLINWTVVFEVTVPVMGSIFDFGRDSDNTPWFNVNPTTRGPGPWPPDQFGSVPIPINQRCLVAFVFSIDGARTYVDGVLSGSFSAVYTTNFQSMVVKASGGGGILHSARFWNAALTAKQVAEL